MDGVAGAKNLSPRSCRSVITENRCKSKAIIFVRYGNNPRKPVRHSTVDLRVINNNNEIKNPKFKLPIS